MKKRALLFVKRGQNGCRNYLAEDREWVQFLCKLKATGMLARDIKRYAQRVIMGTVLLPSGWSFC